MDFPYIVRQNLVITAATNPRYVSVDNTIINMTLVIADAERGPVELEFAAHADDTEEHGRLLHAYGLALGPLEYVETVTEQKQAIANKRWEVETGGLTLQGVYVNTEDRSKTLLNGAALKAMRNAAYVLRWKTPTGFIDLSSEQVLAFADAVADFVQVCFDREDELMAAVDAGTYNDTMLHLGWPG